MITLNSDPQVAEQQVEAILFYLTACGYIDSEFDLSEKAFVRAYLRKLVTARIDALGDMAPELRFERIEQLARQTFRELSGQAVPLLSAEEVRSLSVRRGSLTPDEFDEIVSSVHGDDGSTSIGLGALGINMVMTLARVANHLAEAGSTVDGAAIHDALATSTDLLAFPNDNPLACGLVAAYPSVCAFEFPIGEYVAGGEVQTVPGFDAVSVVDYLP